MRGFSGSGQAKAISDWRSISWSFSGPHNKATQSSRVQKHHNYLLLTGCLWMRWDGEKKKTKVEKQEQLKKNLWNSFFSHSSSPHSHPSIHPSFLPSLSFSPRSPWCTSSRAGSTDTPWATGWSRRRCSHPEGSSRAQSPVQRLAGSAPERGMSAWPGAAGAEGACQTSDPRWRWDRRLPNAEPNKQAGKADLNIWVVREAV